MTAAPTYMVRQLTHTDLTAFRSVRLAALRLHPEAYGSSFEEEQSLDLGGFVRQIPASPPSAAFGAFFSAELVGTATLVAQSRLKVRHKGNVVGVYVDASHRRNGLGRLLMMRVIAAARDVGLSLLQLAVTSGNQPACRLYQDLGFRVYGTERRALRVGEKWIDNELMALDLD